MADPAYGPQKCVYHVSNGGESGADYAGLLANLRNHVAAVGAESLDLRVVLNGGATALLALAAGDDALRTKLEALRRDGVRFLVCRNSMLAHDIDPDSLYGLTQADIVPAGVAELARLQADGFGYIRP